MRTQVRRRKNMHALISQIIHYYSIILMIYALLSWFPGARDSKFGQIINKLARPYLDIFDRLIPPIGGISFNVIIAIFTLDLIRKGLFTILNLLG